MSVGQIIRAVRGPRPLDTLQLAVVIPLDDVTGEFATRRKIELLRKYGRNPGLDAFPHVSLKLGFPAADPEPFAASLDRLAANCEPFQIGLKDYGFFDEGIVFLDTSPSPDLESLRLRVLAELGGRHGIDPLPIEGAGFHFHVTLGYGFRPREFEEIRANFGRRAADLEFTARHLDLFCHTGRQWVTYHRATLRDGPPPCSPSK